MPADVELQTVLAHDENSIWHAVKTGNLVSIRNLISRNPLLLEERGPVGETILHLAFLYNSPQHLEIAKFLISEYPKCLGAVYEGQEYYGENVLHIAIMNKNTKMVNALVKSAPSLIHGAATGNFFKEGKPCYYGEFPLHFCICTNQQNLASILLENGADINTVDSLGNNLLHMCVIYDFPDLYTWVKDQWIKQNSRDDTASVLLERKEGGPGPGNLRRFESMKNLSKKDVIVNQNNKLPLWRRANYQEFTPLTLAARMGLKDMFAFLIEERKEVQWAYGPITCMLYPLDEMDKAWGDEECGRPSVLQHLLTQSHAGLLMHPRMVSLVNKKWDVFAGRKFYRRFLITSVYLFIFTATTILQTYSPDSITSVAKCFQSEPLDVSLQVPLVDPLLPSDIPGAGVIASPLNPWVELTTTTLPTIVGWLLVYAGAAYKGIQEWKELMNSGVRQYFGVSGAALLENTISICFTGLILVYAIFDALDVGIRNNVLSLAAVVGWSYLLFFLLGFRKTGPFVVMVYKMLIGDVTRFLFIFLVFLGGFSHAFFVLLDQKGVSGFQEVVKTCFMAMLGQFELEKYEHSSLGVTLLVCYVIVVTILLLNLLIAMMGNTYGNINDEADDQWFLERARLISSIENEMDEECRNLPQNRYWTTLGGKRYLQIEAIDQDHFRADKNLQRANRRNSLSR